MTPNTPESNGNLEHAISPRIDREKVIEFIHLTTRDGLTIQEACQVLGITDRTSRNWKNSPWWPTAQRIAEAQLHGEYLHLGLRTLAQASREGSVKAANSLVGHLLKMQTLAPVLNTTATDMPDDGAPDYEEMSEAELRRLLGE